MLKSGNVGPTGERLPRPGPAAALVHRLLHVHEVVRAAARGVPLPGRDAARALPGRRARSRTRCATTSSSSSGRKVIPALEKVTRPDATTRTACASCLALSAQAEDDLVWVLAVGASTGPRPSTPTSAASTTSARSSPPSAAREEAVDYYRELRAEIEERIAPGPGPGDARRRRSSASATASWSRARPTGRASASSGRCSPTRARWSWPPPTPRSAASTTPASATIPRRPLETPGRLLPGLLHEPRACRRASRCSRATCASTRPTAS